MAIFFIVEARSEGVTRMAVFHGKAARFVVDSDTILLTKSVYPNAIANGCAQTRR
jgi:hypothetical protein